VFFADRGPGLAERLEVREAELPMLPSWERRVAIGAARADERDLEPWDGYVAAVASTAGVGAVRTSSGWLNAVSIEASESGIDAVARLPFVLSVRPVSRSAFRSPVAVPSPNGTEGLSDGQLAQIGIGGLLSRGYSGEGVVVGVLDSGFNLFHTAFSEIDVLDMYDFLMDDPDPSQQEGDPPGQAVHGTAVLSIIGAHEDGIYSGGAPGASFLLAKTEDTSDEYEAEEDYWVEGLEWLEAGGADIVSSSLGYIEWYDFEDLDGNTAVTTIAADIAASRGMPVFNAVGNEGPGEGTLIAPADGDSVMAVGAVDSQGIITGFSSRGPTADGRIKPDVTARGAWTVFVADAATGYSSGNGTSFATPLVSSAAALLLQAHPEWTSLDVMDALRATASGSASPDIEYGWGLVDAHAAWVWRSVAGCVRRSDDGSLLGGYPVTLAVGGSTAIVTTNQYGWFSCCPGELGTWSITGAGGAGEVLEQYGILDEDGVEVDVYVDMGPSGSGPSVFPSPSTDGVWIGFDMASAGDASISVLSLTGTEVWSEVRQGLPAGSYRAPLEGEASWWDGLDVGGRQAASGTYLAVVRTGGEPVILKFALVR
jgi:subtilisin family serine protease